MNTKKSVFTKTMSIFLTVIMLAGIVFCAPVELFAPTAEAASAGNYFIRVTWKVTEDGTFKKDYDGYVTSSDDDEDHQDDSAGMSIEYITQNGTGSTQYLDMDIKSELGSTGDKTFTKELGGFPTMVYMYMNNDSALAWADTIAIVSKIEVASAANGVFTTVWSGTMQVDSISKEYGVSVGTNGDQTYLNSDSDTYIKNSSYNWSMPTPTTVALSSSSQIDMAVPLDDETVSTDNILATVYDQYGVTWKDPATWVLTTTNTPTISSENLTGYGISLRSGLASGNCIVDIASGADNYRKFTGDYFYINAYCENAKSACIPIKLVDESYVVRFFNLAGDTVLKTQRVASGSYATAPDISAFASELSAPDATYHYTIGNWDKDFSNVTSDLDVYTTQNSVRHDYSYNITSVTTSPTHKATGTAVGTCICGKSGTVTLSKVTDHDYTRQVVADINRANKATCTTPAVYWYVCQYCNSKSSLDTYTYGEPLGHDFTSEVISDDTLVAEATCASPAVYVYTCSVCSKISDSDTFTYGSAADHDYGEATYTWDADYNCTATKVCKNDPTHILTETVKGVLTTTTAPDCENDGEGTYTATFKDTTNFTAKTLNVTLSATGHDYGEATYTWDADYNCTATKVCKNDGSHTITETVAGVYSVVTPADCQNEGTGTYTATFTNAAFTEQTKNVTISKLSHSYTGEVKSNNNGTHMFKCVNGCGLYGAQTACTYGDYTETVAPGCTTKGSKQRECTACGYIQTAEIDEVGHKYGTPVYTWNDDNTCTATATCALNPAHTLTETVAGVYSVVNAATCKAAGEGKYTATFTNAEFIAQTKPVTITALEHSYTGAAKDNGDGTHSLMCVNGCGLYGEAAAHTYGDFVETLAATCVTEGEKQRVCSVCGNKDIETIGFSGHSYGEATYTWDAEFNCTATRVCANDASHKITETVKGVYSEVTPAGCETKGEGKYTATFENTADFTAQTTTVEIAVTGHNFTGEVKSNNNGTHSFLCENGCGKYGATVNCTYGDYTEISAPTCTEKGEKTRTCTACSYVDTVEVEAKGHNYGAATYTWDENYNCTATKVCLTDDSHKITETVKGVYSVVTPAQCLVPGAAVYTATFKNTADFTVQVKAVVVAPLGHDYVSHAAKNATCTEKGWEAYNTCSRCDYTSYKEISATGHTPGAAATCTGAQRCTKCNAILNNALGHDYRQTGTVAATCLEEGKIIYSCSRCSASYSTATDKVDHADNNGDGICDVCGHDIQADRIANCSHLCHKSGFLGFIWKIVNLFNKLFKINQYCDCGAKHW